MPSYDKTFRIERYDHRDSEGNIESFSFGCPDLDLMGYDSVKQLCDEMASKIALITSQDLPEITVFSREST